MKYIAKPFKLVNNENMGASFESDVKSKEFMDNIGMQVNWVENNVATASIVIQDLTYTADSNGVGGNAISIEYVDPGSASQSLAVNVVSNAISVSLGTSAAVAASKIIQDLTYTADTAGVAGNDISVEYLNPGVKGSPLSATLDGTDISVNLGTSFDVPATLVEGDLTFTAKMVGVSGNDIEIAFIDPAVADSNLSIGVVENSITVNLATDGGTQASLVNQGITYTAINVGTDGNDITIELVDPSANDEPLNIAVVGTDISVTLATSNVGAITTTANTLVTALLLDSDVTDLINVSGTGGSALVALAQTNLEDGTDYNLSSTANDLASALNGSTTVFNLIGTDVTGTSSNVQSDFAMTNLSGGNTSKVISTATQIKSLLDGIAGVAALVNITVSGTGSTVQVPQDETSLTNGSAYAFTSNATAVKAIVDGSGAAAALVNVAVTGTAADIQVVQEETFLEGGLDGSPIGVISVQCSIDYNPTNQVGSFYDLTFDPILAQPNADSSGYIINLNQLPFPYYRIKYLRTSGDGLLNVWVFGQQV